VMNAPAAWAALGGIDNAGAGMKIGIIDTGIDQNHPALSDPTLPIPTGFPICTTGHPEDCAFTNHKVIVARSYIRQLALEFVADPKNPAAQSQPDDYTPRDRFGHGTAVASTAAGFTNTGPGITTSGTAVSFSGMAPKAYLGNYKVYGSPGVNDFPTDDLIQLAVQDAVKDGMDVINFSSGAPALSGWSIDPVAMAFEAAAQKAVVIVAAGDSGSNTAVQGISSNNYPYYQSISSPGTAPSVITVGATTNSHLWLPSVSIAGSGIPSNLKGIAGTLGDSVINGDGAVVNFRGSISLTGATTAPIVDITRSPVGDSTGLACSALTAGSLMNAIALIQRGTCSFDVKAINAQTAGAIGVIFYNTAGSSPVTPIGITEDFLGPTIIVSNSDGVNLKNYIDGTTTASVTIDISGIEQDDSAYDAASGETPPVAVNQFASYSSMGPTPDGLIKPDMVAIGGDDGAAFGGSGLYVATQSYDPTPQITTFVSLYSATGYMAVDGASFSAPMVAGAAAMVKQAHPTLTPAQIKSALVNTVANTVTTDDFGFNVDVEWMGSGLLNAGAAAATTVVATPSTLSFGFLTAGGSLPSAVPVTISNKGSASVTLTATVAQNTAVTGTSVTATLASPTVAAGSSTTLTVSVTGNIPAAGEYSGYITLSGTGTSLRIPYMYLVGNGQNPNVSEVSGFAGGLPGQDGGSLIVQLVDAVGVQMVGAPVMFTSASRNAFTFRSVSGEPACTPASSSSSVTCPTDQYGFAYADVLLGNTAGQYNVNMSAGGYTFTGQVFISNTVPSISTGGVVNNATFGNVVAPGSYVAIFGQNLLDTADLSNYAFYNNLSYDLATTARLPLSLDFTSVSFDVPSAGISVPGYLYFVSPGQVNAFVPWELAGQSSVQVKVNVDEGSYSNVITVPLSQYAPGFYLNTGNVADALDLNYNLISASNPAVRGQVIQLYVTGLGPVTNQPNSGDPLGPAPGSLSNTLTKPTVSIGGQQAAVGFSGLAGYVGLYQVNVTVPTGISAGNQPITISIGGQTSPTSTSGSSPQTIVIPVK
jgi:minor extracellular serine protease Vpr